MHLTTKIAQSESKIYLTNFLRNWYAPGIVSARLEDMHALIKISSPGRRENKIQHSQVLQAFDFFKRAVLDFTDVIL